MSFLPPFDPSLIGPSFFDPYWQPGYLDPYAPPTTRRRIEAPRCEVEGGQEGQEGTARAPFTVGAPGWNRSIPVDFIEREKEYVVRADIPGVHKDEIHVEVHDEDVLRFGHNPNAEREREDVEEPGVYHRAERVSTFRNRNLRMPKDADMTGEIKAKYEDGVLTITIPKKQAGMPAGKMIPIA